MPRSSRKPCRAGHERDTGGLASARSRPAGLAASRERIADGGRGLQSHRVLRVKVARRSQIGASHAAELARPMIELPAPARWLSVPSWYSHVSRNGLRWSDRAARQISQIRPSRGTQQLSEGVGPYSANREGADVAGSVELRLHGAAVSRSPPAESLGAAGVAPRPPARGEVAASVQGIVGSGVPFVLSRE